MNKVHAIYSRLTLSYVKQRTLLLILLVQSIVLSLVVLIFANVIISNAYITGELDYNQVRVFYTLSILILFVLVFVFTPYFLSNTLNKLYANNIIEHFLSVRIGISDIVFAAFLRGLVSVLIMFFSALPIISISFYFGGIGLIKIIKLFIFLLCFILLLSSVTIYISSSIINSMSSMIVSYIICFILMLLHLFILNSVINFNHLIFVYFFISILISISLLAMSCRTKIFSL